MTTLFGVPGAQIYPLFDALHGTDVEVIVPRHEQAAAYMAMGYAKSTGRTGVFTVVPGPGVLNAAAALCTAMGNCAPVVCLTGQVPSSFLGRGRGHLARARGSGGTLRTLIKDAWRIESSTAASRLVNKAFRDAAGGRPGPDRRRDVLGHDGGRSAGRHRARRRAAPPSRTSTRMPSTPRVRLLASAKKPMIMCGAGAQHAAAEVAALAETLQAPVTAFRSGRGVVPEDHPLGVASVAARELWDDVDVLVGVGSRLEMPYMRWGDSMRYERKPSRGPKLIRIDIDPAEMRRFEPDVAVDRATPRRRAGCSRSVSQRASRRTATRRREIAAAKRIGRSGVRAHRAADLVPARDPRRLASRRHPRARAIAGRVYDLHGRLPDLGAAHLYLGRFPGHTRLRFSDGAGCQSGQSRQSRRVRDR